MIAGDVLEQSYEFRGFLRFPAARDSWRFVGQARSKNCQLFRTDLMDDRAFVRLGPAGNFGVKPNDLAPTINQQVHRKLQSPGDGNPQTFVSGRPKQRCGQICADKQRGLIEVLQIFDQDGEGLEFDTSFHNNFCHKRLDRHRGHEPNCRRSHELPNFEQSQAFGGCRNVEQDTVEFGAVDQVQRFRLEFA